MGVAYGINPIWASQTNDGRTHIATKGIVQSGLRLNLDAGVSSSYPGSGNTWTDLSGNGNNITLSSTTYTSDAGGGIISSSSSSSATRSSALTNMNFSGGGFTISVWIKHSGTVSTARVQRYFTMASSPLEGPVLRHNSSYNQSLHGYIFDSTSNFRSIDLDSQIVTNTYYNCVFTYDGSVFRLYRNNSEVGTLSQTITLPTPGSSFSLFNSGGEYFEGSMYIAHYYNRALTASEIQKNFNALRGRFGI
jgi:hypothetical protein